MTFDLNSATFKGNIYAKNLDNKGFTSSVVRDKFATGAFDSGSVGYAFQKGSISGKKFRYKTISANKIKAGTITGDLIKADTITSEEISDTTITNSLIRAGSITEEKIETGTIDSSYIIVSEINSSHISTDLVNAIQAEVNSQITQYTKASKVTVTKEAQFDNSLVCSGNVSTSKINNMSFTLGTINYMDGTQKKTAKVVLSS